MPLRSNNPISVVSRLAATTLVLVVGTDIPSMSSVVIPDQDGNSVPSVVSESIPSLSNSISSVVSGSVPRVKFCF